MNRVQRLQLRRPEKEPEKRSSPQRRAATPQYSGPMGKGRHYGSLPCMLSLIRSLAVSCAETPPRDGLHGGTAHLHGILYTHTCTYDVRVAVLHQKAK